MNIGTNIRALRRNCEMTQEELAEKLHISVSAVSQWEQEKTMPDITLLPALAIIFGVSTDEILGVSNEMVSKKLEEFNSSYVALYKEKRFAEMAELSKQTQREIPNNYKLIYDQAFALDCLSDGEYPKRREEIIRLCQRVLEKCTDTNLRIKATQMICKNYSALGDKESAILYAEQLPKNKHMTKYFIMRRAGLVPDEKRIPLYQSELNSLYWMMAEYAKDISDADYRIKANKATIHERIARLEQLIAICKTIYGEKPLDKNADLYEYYRIIGALYLFAQDEEKAIDHFLLAYEYAVAFDEEYANKDVYTSPLLSGLEARDRKDFNYSPAADLLERFTNQDRYKPLYENERFCALVEKLRARA